MTLLTAVQDAQRELSLAVTSTLVADGQETQNLLYRLARKEAQEILRRLEYTFPSLRRTHSFTASLASLQATGKPADFKRMVRATAWNMSKDRQIGGPLSEQEWALANGEPVTSMIQQYFMLRHDGLHIFPTPTVADTITYDYVINTPVLAADGTSYKENFSADTDTYLLGDEVLTLAVVWRYLSAKGRDYAEALKDYEMALAAESTAARGARTVSLAPIEDDSGVTLPHVPDTGFGA